MWKIILAPIDKVKPNPLNVNILPRQEKEHLKELMRWGGIETTPPVIVHPHNGEYAIIDGEQRWQVAKELGWDKIPILLLDISEMDALRLSISYNRIRGTINWFKVAEIVKKYGEEVLRDIEPPDTIRKLKRLEEIDDEVKKQIIEEQANGKRFDLDQLLAYVEGCRKLKCEPDLQKQATKAFLTYAPPAKIFKTWVDTAKQKRELARAEEERRVKEKLQVERIIQTKTENVKILTLLLRCSCGKCYEVRFDKQDILEAEVVRGEIHAKGLEKAVAEPRDVETRCGKCGYTLNADVHGEEEYEVTCGFCRAKGKIKVANKVSEWTWEEEKPAQTLPSSPPSGA